MSKVTIETPEGIKKDFVHAFGLTCPYEQATTFPSTKDLPKHIQEIRELTVRDDDIYLSTYPKCGTNWVWEIINMLIRGAAEHSKNTKGVLFLDVRTPTEINNCESPRVLNSHYPCRLSPRGLFEKKNKIVHVMRNPKDAFVSFYHHSKAMFKGQEFVKDFGSFLPFCLGEYGPCKRFCFRNIQNIKLYIARSCKQNVILGYTESI